MGVVDPDPNYGPFPDIVPRDHDIVSESVLVLFWHFDHIWDLMPEGPDLMSDRFPRISMHF